MNHKRKVYVITLKAEVKSKLGLASKVNRLLLPDCGGAASH